MDIKNILLEVIEEASSGKIVIDNEEWYIYFNTVIYNNEKIIFDNRKSDNETLLKIDDLDIFVDILSIYINKELKVNRKIIGFRNNEDYNKIKFLISYIFVNATFYDLNNPVQYVKRLINYLDDNTLSIFDCEKSIELGNIFFDSKLSIKNTKQSVLMETPNKIELTLISIDNSSIFKLPEISYGIVEENGSKVCYVYSILNKETTNNLDKTKFQKNISRLLYKLNDNIFDNETNEFKDYKTNKSDYYPENISDVSVSSVLSLYIFISLLSKVGVNKIKGVPYLPIRYNARDIAAENIDDEKVKSELKKRNNNIQQNITNKFIRTFNRLSFHMTNFKVDTYPFEVDEFITCYILSEPKFVNNDLLGELDILFNKNMKF